MTDRELKKRLKKLGIMLLLIIVGMISLSVYILNSTKAKLSVYTNSEYSDHLKALGINEEEFMEYLSIAGFLVDTDTAKEVQTLNMATHFIDTMCSSYEVEVNEEGKKSYDASMVNEVISELTGEYVKENLDGKAFYTYHKDQNSYVQMQEPAFIPYCIQIEEIHKKENEMEVTYQLANFTKEQLAEYMTNHKKDVETKTVQATILNNNDYRYSKYFVSKIEEK